jgi:hypothetical protein
LQGASILRLLPVNTFARGNRYEAWLDSFTTNADMALELKSIVLFRPVGDYSSTRGQAAKQRRLHED